MECREGIPPRDGMFEVLFIFFWLNRAEISYSPSLRIFLAGLTKSLKLGGGPGDAVTVHFRWIFESYSNSGFFWTRKFENRAEKGIICSFF